MENPSLVVRLGSGGGLEVELPGTEGTPRLLPVFDLDDIVGILEGMLGDRTGIGLDGSPTRQLIWHQAKHSIFPNDKCPFCRRAGERLAASRQGRKQFRAVGAGDVSVRKIPLGKKAEILDVPATATAPAGLSKAAKQMWQLAENKRVAEKADRKLRKEGKSKMLFAKDLGL